LSDPQDMLSEDDEWMEDEDLEDGEVNLFANIPWINENIGSMLEAQLTRPTDPDQCRQCLKRMPEVKPIPERFCSPKCREEWENLLKLRIAQGKHDLRVRGYD